MKKLILGVLCSMSFLWLTAQQTASDSTLTTSDTVVQEIKEPLINFESGIFVEIGADFTPTLNTYRLMSSIGAGLQYKFLYAGFAAEEFEGGVTTTLVFPNDFNLRSKQGKVFIGTRVMNTRFVEIDLRVSYGLGDMVWERDSNNEKFIRSEYSSFQPEIRVLATPFDWLKAYASCGYKRISNLDIAKITNDDFSGFIFGIGLRCGIYH